MSSLSDRIHFLISFPDVPEPVGELWRVLQMFLAEHRSLPKQFEMSQIAGHPEKDRSRTLLKVTPDEVGQIIEQKRLTGFRVDTGHLSRSVGYSLLHFGEGEGQSVLRCRIEQDAKAPSDWSELIDRLSSLRPIVGAWQWRLPYQVWQGVREIRDHYERVYGPVPPGYQRSYQKVELSLTPKPDRVFVDISKNPGRSKKLIPTIDFYPTAEMWLGPHFWQYAKCTKEEALAADFFLEKRETPHFIYLKCWPEPFTRPDGEQGRTQQRLWKLFFHEDCEWPPGSGGICDEPMFGPPGLMPREAA